MKKMQISFIGNVMLVFDVFCRNYVCMGDKSSVLVVPVRYVCTDGVWETISGLWGCMEKTVVGIRWGIPSCAYVFFPTGRVFLFCFGSYFSLKSRDLSCLYPSAHNM